MSRFCGAKDRISLDRLCRVLGLEGKTGMSGADVWPAVQAGKMDEIASYCRHDVAITRSVYKRLTFAEGL
jgi:predicted PolB exonuclease-like 3'-5' exonuclease